MKISGFKPDSLVDGEGMRFVIFTAGCPHKCEGCHNEAMQKTSYGQDYTISEIITEIRKYSDWIDGITLSGGDPLYQFDDTKNLLGSIRKDEALKKKNIWLYTGFNFKEIPKGITQHVDVIIDGLYDKSLPSAKWRGSNNQNIMVKFKGTNRFIKRVYN